MGFKKSQVQTNSTRNTILDSNFFFSWYETQLHHIFIYFNFF